MVDRRKRVLMARRASRLFTSVVVLLAVALAAVVVASWVVTSLWPEAHVRSLLSGDGTRWMFGHVADSMAGVAVVWLLLWGMAVGAVVRSRLWEAVCCRRRLLYRERVALRLVVAEVVALVAVLLLLVAVPHALLLSVTGSLFPSSFSQGIVPHAALAVTLCAVTYGLASGALRSAGDVVAALLDGIRLFAPLFLLYVLVGMIYVAVRFVWW